MTQAGTLSRSGSSTSFVMMEGVLLKRKRTIDEMMVAGEMVTKKMKVEEGD